MRDEITNELLNVIKNKGIFSEYLPESFNLEGFNIWGAGASYKDNIEPCFYNMSRLNYLGDRRIIGIPELAGYISFVNYLHDNKNILEDIIELSHDDENSLSRIVNENYEVINTDSKYGEDVVKVQEISENAYAKEDEHERSEFVSNMIYKINKAAGSCGVLHIDISGFYRNIYTHALTTIKIGAENAKKAFRENSQDANYKTYVDLDTRVRGLNGKRTNGLLVGPFISRVLSEAVLARVDIELRDNGLDFVRYADDYEFYIRRNDEVEKTKSIVTSILSKYYFEINSEKTKYEKYPFYIFTNFEKIIESIVGKEKLFDSIDIVELFNRFLEIERSGDKGAIRYLLKSYKNGYKVDDKQLYASYLLNVLCNDERALGLACSIIINEYENKRISIDERFKGIVVEKLNYELEKNHDLEVIWLVYLLKYIGVDISQLIIEKIFESENDLAKIILIHELEDAISVKMLEDCWEKTTSWILLYEIVYKLPNKRMEFFEKLNIKNNRGFYNKLFDNSFTFYKKRVREEIKEEIDSRLPIVDDELL